MTGISLSIAGTTKTYALSYVTTYVLASILASIPLRYRLD